MQSHWLERSTQSWCLQHRLSNLVRQHIEDTAAGRDTSYTAHALTMAHSDFNYWRGLWDVMDTLKSANEAFLAPMLSLAQVFSLSIIYQPHHSSLAQALPLPASQLSSLRAAYDEAINDFADNHVQTVVEAYGLTEYELDSAFARADQTPYEAIFEGAKRSEMSGEGVRHLWPLMVETRGLWKKIEEEERGRAKL